MTRCGPGRVCFTFVRAVARGLKHSQTVTIGCDRPAGRQLTPNSAKHWLGFGFLLSVGLFMAAVLGASPVRQLGNRHCRSRHVVLTAAFATVAVGLLTLSVTYPLRMPSPSQIGNLLSIASISASVVSEQPTPKKTRVRVATEIALTQKLQYEALGASHRCAESSVGAPRGDAVWTSASAGEASTDRRTPFASVLAHQSGLTNAAAVSATF